MVCKMIGDSYFISIDAGTTRFKAALVSQRGEIIAKSDYYYGIDEGLFHEYKRAAFKNALISTVSEIIKNTDKNKIDAVGITGHGPTLIPVSKDGSPQFSAVGYLDERVKKYIKRLAEKENNRITSTMYIPIALFFKEELSKVYEKTHKFLQSFDYIAYVLTGEFTASSSSTGIKPWEKITIEKTGLDINKFPKIYYMGEKIGNITVSCENLLGIPKGTPVFAIGVDFAAALVGTNTLDKGRSCERAGSSGGINLCWDKAIDDNRLLCYKHFISGFYNVAGITSSSGRALEWIKKILSIKELPSFKDINKNEKIIFLPYLQGERTPLWNPYAKGIFFGLMEKHDRRDILISVFLGIALSIRDCMEIIEENDCKFSSPVVTTGGQARNDWFVQLKADVTGKPFVKTQTEDAELIGTSAILATATGHFTDLASAAKKTVKTGKVFKPRKDKFQYYSELYKIYKELRSNFTRFF